MRTVDTPIGEGSRVLPEKVCQAHSLDPDAKRCSGHWRRFMAHPCKTARRMRSLERLREEQT